MKKPVTMNRFPAKYPFPNLISFFIQMPEQVVYFCRLEKDVRDSLISRTEHDA